ncbi:MAG: ATP synthase F1 subunit delta [Microscillaceae bacterium]|nr:ATP synthase F1 subunit delta [Microscillaceae bacterium]
MSNIAVATRYAKPLIELAEEKNALDQVYADLELYRDTIQRNPELRAVMLDPVIHGMKKLGILEKLFKDKVHPLTYSVIELLSRKNREEIFYDICAAYSKLYNEKKGILHVRVQTPIPLDESQQKALQAKLAQQLQKTIVLLEEVKPDLIGGLVLLIEDKIIDNSIRSSLKRLKKKFTQQI